MNSDKLRDQTATHTRLQAVLAELDEIKYIDNSRVLELAREAETLADSLHDIEAWAVAANYEAWALSIARNLEQSTEKALQTLEVAQRSNFPAIEAQALNTLASNFFIVQDFATFRQLIEYQLDIAEKFNLRALKQAALHDLGTYYSYTGKSKKGAQYLQKSLELDDPTRHRGVIAGITQLNLGIGQRLEEQYKPAVRHLKQAQEILIPAGAAYYAHNIFIQLTGIYLDLEEETLAASYAQQAKDYAEQHSLPLLRLESLQNFAKLLKFQRRFVEAEAALQQALVVIQEHNLLGEESIVYGDLLLLHEEVGNAEKAAHYQAELQRVTEINNARSRDQRLNLLLQVYQSSQKTYQRQQRRIVDESGDFNLQVLNAANQQRAAEQDFAGSKRAVMQRLAHEFRTPLAVIRSGTEILSLYFDRMSEEQRKSKLENITNRVDWMTTILDDILLLLQLNRAERKAQLQVVDLDQLIRHSLDEIAQWFDDPARVILRFESPVHTVRVDPDFLQKIIIHLLSNALKFSKQPVTLALEIHDQSLRLCVEDRGIGIPPDEIDQVREVFYRASNLNEIPGLGIGLSVVDQAVNSCGGRWQITSVLNEGTMVEVVLPVQA